MQLIVDTLLPFDRSLVFRTYRDELPKLVELVPNVRRVVVLSREDEGLISRLVNEWEGGGEIPAAARMVIGDSMLGWTDYATWNETAWTCEWRIETRAFREAVKCHGVNTYLEQGSGQTRIEIRGDLLIDTSKIRGVPKLLSKKVGNAVSEFLCAKVTPNLKATNEGLGRYLERREAS